MKFDGHTPGPWEADRNGLGELAIFTNDGRHIKTGRPGGGTAGNGPGGSAGAQIAT